MRSYTFIAATYPFRKLIVPLARGLIALRKKRIILVFGMSRSGTSMLNKFLALGPGVISMHEPEVELLRLRFGPKRFFTQQFFWEFVHAEEQRDFKVHALVCIAMLAALKAPRSTKVVVIKPIALLDVIKEACEALPHADVAYICRHPAGRSESILRQARHDQNIENLALPILESLGQDWGQTNCRIQKLFQQHPHWHWVSFEKVTLDPLTEIKVLYEKLALPWDETVEKEIEKRTSDDGDYYAVQRNASQQADKWRKSLSEEQVEAIRRGSLPFETNLYESF